MDENDLRAMAQDILQTDENTPETADPMRVQSQATEPNKEPNNLPEEGVMVSEDPNTPDSIIERAAKELLQESGSEDYDTNNDYTPDSPAEALSDAGTPEADNTVEAPSHSTDTENNVAYNGAYGSLTNQEQNTQQNLLGGDNPTDNGAQKEKEKEKEKDDMLRQRIIDIANGLFNEYDGLSHAELQKISKELHEEQQELHQNLEKYEAEIDTLEEKLETLEAKGVSMHNGQPVYQSDGATGYLYTKGPNGEIQKLDAKEEQAVYDKAGGDPVTQDEIDDIKARIQKLDNSCCSIKDRLQEIEKEKIKLAEAQDRLNSQEAQEGIHNFVALDSRARSTLINNADKLTELELAQSQATDSQEIERLTQEINALEQQQEELNAYRSMMNTEQVAASAKFNDGLDHYLKAIELVGEDPDLLAEFNSYKTNYWNDFKNEVYGQTPDYLRNDFITHDLGGDAQIWNEKFVTNDVLSDFATAPTFENNDSLSNTEPLAADAITSFDTSSSFKPTVKPFALAYNDWELTADEKPEISSVFHQAVTADDLLLNTNEQATPELLSSDTTKQPDDPMKEHNEQPHTHCAAPAC